MPQGIHPRVCSAFILLGLLVALTVPFVAQAGTSPAGEWTGTMRTPDGQEVEILLKLDQQGAAWTGTLESEAIGETAVTGLKVTDTRISFTFKPEGAPFPSHFTGTYIAADDRVSGSFSQRGVSRFVKFRRDPDTVLVHRLRGVLRALPAVQRGIDAGRGAALPGEETVGGAVQAVGKDRCQGHAVSSKPGGLGCPAGHAASALNRVPI